MAPNNDTASAGRGGPAWQAFTALALVGDFAVFVLFAAFGRGQHGESRGAVEIVFIALPFFAAWAGCATYSGMYRVRRQAGLPFVARRTALTWLFAWPVALAARAIIQYRGIPLSFDIVALIANGIFLVTWRVALQVATRLPARTSV